MQSRILTYRGEEVGFVLYSSDNVTFKPLRDLIMARSPIWFWLRRKIYELGFSLAYQSGGIITIYLYGDEHLNIKEVEKLVGWAYHKLLKGT